MFSFSKAQRQAKRRRPADRHEQQLGGPLASQTKAPNGLQAEISHEKPLFLEHPLHDETPSSRMLDHAGQGFRQQPSPANMSDGSFGFQAKSRGTDDRLTLDSNPARPARARGDGSQPKAVGQSMIEVYDDADDPGDFDSFDDRFDLGSLDLSPLEKEEAGEDDAEGRIDDGLADQNDQKTPPAGHTNNKLHEPDFEKSDDGFIEIYAGNEPKPVKNEIAAPSHPARENTAFAPSADRADRPVEERQAERVVPAKADKTAEEQTEGPPISISLTGQAPFNTLVPDRPASDHHAEPPLQHHEDLSGTTTAASENPASRRPPEAAGETPFSDGAADLPIPAVAALGNRTTITPSRLPSKGNMPLKAVSPGMLPTLVTTEIPRLRRFASAMIGDEAMADQLVLATVEHALAGPSDLLQNQEIGLSLLTLLHRLRSEALTPSDRHSPPMAGSNLNTVLFQRLPGLDRDELLEFAGAMASLSEEDREILLLIALENLDYREMASVIRIPAGRIMSKIARARDQLRQALSVNAPEPHAAQGDGALSAAQQQVADLELHGYLDGEVSEARLGIVEDYLDQNRAAAERLVHYGIQGDLIRRLYGPLSNRPIPAHLAERLQAIAKPDVKPSRSGQKTLIFSALLLVVLILAAAAWFLPPSVMDLIPSMDRLLLAITG